ncbi:hypothetical protein FISHEDRAFT_68620 [Fistulina hepatica ATCC 64428]|uniref:DUF6533 domain-containing protein n=1 Tax=Fistulina hepatica ATCC 64428 TaxID=1128425 RepID=A0A0D7APT4_9AGAR|nr:hypothetical protein FISHEDRAFT_68620 [Fistulina hepatica ATCC 64428]
MTSDSMDATRVYDTRVHASLHLVGISILFFDQFITLDREVNAIWLRPKTKSSYGFLIHRYVALSGFIAVTSIWFLNLSVKVRHIPSVVTVSYRATGMRPLSLIPSSHARRTPSYHSRGARLATSWEALMVFDALIFFLTFARTYSVSRRTRALWSNFTAVPLTTIMLRDGAIYFAVMSLANLANLAGSYLKGCLSSFTSCISITMMSRLMLNLHERAHVGILAVRAPHSTWTSGNRRIDALELDDVSSPTSPTNKSFGPGNPFPSVSYGLGSYSTRATCGSIVGDGTCTEPRPLGVTVDVNVEVATHPAPTPSTTTLNSPDASASPTRLLRSASNSQVEHRSLWQPPWPPW